MVGLRKALEADANYVRLFDPDRVVLIGHSLGGYTVLGLAGAWSTWPMDDVLGVIALAPFGQPLLHNNVLANITVPVLVEGGSKDNLVPAPAVYAALTTSRCKVIYTPAGHLAWVDNRETEWHDAIVADTLAFVRAIIDRKLPDRAVLTDASRADVDCR
jgi:pimeloyl-ACP methyl ester carboxylesterase